MNTGPGVVSHVTFTGLILTALCKIAPRRAMNTEPGSMPNAAFDVEAIMSDKVSGGVWTVQGVIQLVLLLLATHFVAGHGPCRNHPGRYKCNSTKSVHCEAGQRPQIVEAYYLNTSANSKVCRTNCEPTKKADPHQCLKDLRKTELQCVQRLSFTDLDVVYSNCVSPLYCPFNATDKLLMSMPGNFLVHYYCIAESSTMDPCQFSGSRRTNASFLLPLNSPGCQRHCDVTPLNTNKTLSFNYRFIQGFDDKSRSVSDNELLYRFIYEKPDENVTWEKLNRSYYTDFRRFRSLTKLEFWFGIRQPDIIRHLWVSFNDEEVEVFCEETNSKKEVPTEDDGNTTRTVTVAVVVVLAAVVIAIVLTAIVIRNRRHGRTDNPDEPQNHPRAASLPSPVDSEYAECILPEDTSPAALPSRDPKDEPTVVTSTGCDMGGDYVHLRHDAKAGSVGGKAESDNYDHMPGFGKGGEGDVYNMLQRERQRQEVVDNVYSTTSEG